MTNSPDWRELGVRVVRHDQLDPSTPQTPGMHRGAAISRASVAAEKIWPVPCRSSPAPRPGRIITAGWKA